LVHLGWKGRIDRGKEIIIALKKDIIESRKEVKSAETSVTTRLERERGRVKAHIFSVFHVKQMRAEQEGINGQCSGHERYKIHVGFRSRSSQGIQARTMKVMRLAELSLLPKLEGLDYR